MENLPGTHNSEPFTLSSSFTRQLKPNCKQPQTKINMKKYRERDRVREEREEVKERKKSKESETHPGDALRNVDAGDEKCGL